MSPVERLEGQLARAEASLARAEARENLACAASFRATLGGLTGYDSAILSGTRRKVDRKGTYARRNAYDREAAATLLAVELAREVGALGRQLVRARAEAARVRFVAADFVGAVAVRDRFGWHRVVRVNTTTVAVETGFSWTDRIPFENVLQIRVGDIA